ncbi:hypothetical protein [Ulvibacter antarcticus]|uniref:hypothetical protein n=1 Tax=Ulvibacter antarcticus TaxID=442714 RepID=UPI000EF9B269|nr:hypothetical protein [Ulvibacter antarcticus]
MIAITYFKKKDPKLRILLSKQHKEIMTECCFDWLITDQKVACEVYAMHSLYFLGTESDWILPELQTIIVANIHQRSPAYKARGKYVLEKIEKFNTSQNSLKAD